MNAQYYLFVIIPAVVAVWIVVAEERRKRARKNFDPRAFKYEPISPKHYARVEAERRERRRHVRYFAQAAGMGVLLGVGAIVFIKIVVDLCMN